MKATTSSHMKQPHGVTRSVLILAAILLLHRLSVSQELKDIIYLDPPKDIDHQLYLSSWADLQESVTYLESHDTLRAESCLQNLIRQGKVKDGSMNLIAQIQRHRGNLDEAWESNRGGNQALTQRASALFSEGAHCV
jgi:Tfp pilus assembly protein PilF